MTVLAQPRCLRRTSRLSTPLSFILVFCAVAIQLGITPSAAQEVADRASGRIIEVEVPAPSLKGNLMGTAITQEAAIYLPPSYDREPPRRYPVIYMLHGVFDRYSTWLAGGFDVPVILNRLIAAGDLPEAIAVMPNGFNPLGGGFYRNSPVSGDWADYIADDLVGYIDGNYRTMARPASRAVTGHSMGGYGAIHLGMTRPDVFSVVWAMSPCCLSATDDLSFGNDAWRRTMRFRSPEDPKVALQNGDFYPVALLGFLTAFSPDASNPPLHVEFPFELVRHEVVLIDSVNDRYLDRFPVREVHDARDALRNLRGLGLDVGLGDQFIHIPVGTLEFSRRLGEERIPHVLDVYDGDHRKRVATRLEQVILPWIGRRLQSGDME